MGKIKYTEDLASKIQERFNIADSTIRNWKQYKAIPDGYITITGEVGKPIQKEQHAAVQALFQTPYLNFNQFDLSYYPNRILDLKNGDRKITVREHSELKEQFGQFVSALRALSEELTGEKLKVFIQDKRIKKAVFFLKRSNTNYIISQEISAKKLTEFDALIKVYLEELERIQDKI